MASARFKKLTDLYVRRLRVEGLPDDMDVYVRAINSFERDECAEAATIARSRMIMALENKGEERLKIEARFAEFGTDKMRDELVEARMEDKIPEVVNGIRDDPEWRERMAVLERSDNDSGRAMTESEVELISKLNTEFFDEMNRRRDEEEELQKLLTSQMDDEELLQAYLKEWLEKRARKLANEEYNLTEVLLATEWGDGEKLFESKKDVRDAPGDLYEAILSTLQKMAMDDRDPKDSASDQSSSGSSPSPNAAEASDNSGLTATPTEPPGTSPQPSLTP
jgi:hypothetical protein